MTAFVLSTAGVRLATLTALFMLVMASGTAAEPLGNATKGLGLQGYDPVSYQVADGPLVGLESLTTVEAGVTYRFATDANRTAFTAAPQRYLPQYGGWCAYAMADGDFVEINPKTFKVADGKVFLFYHTWLANTLTTWNKDETNLHAKADASWARIVKARASQ